MKKIVQNYLEEQCAFDANLRDKYNASAIDKCIEYITEMARKELGGKNGAIPDEKVFHWAREYFVDGIAEKEIYSGIAHKVNSLSPEKKKKMKEAFAQLELEFN